MVPQLGMGCWMPSPKKLKVASVSGPGDPQGANDDHGAEGVGEDVAEEHLVGRRPRAWAAVTYSRFFTARTWLRITRASLGQPTTPRARAMVTTLGSRMATTAMRRAERDGHEDLGDPHEQIVHPPAQEAGQSSDDGPEEEGGPLGQEADGEGDAGSVDEPAQEIPAQPTDPQGVGGRGRLEAGPKDVLGRASARG